MLLSKQKVLTKKKGNDGGGPPIALGAPWDFFHLVIWPVDPRTGVSFHFWIKNRLAAIYETLATFSLSREMLSNFNIFGL
jgi:hypothetical protein